MAVDRELYNLPITNPSNPQNEETLLRQLQTILMNKTPEEAHSFAIENKLWSHALILANQLNSELLKITIQKFSEICLAEGTPLRTNYLLATGNPNGKFLF